MDELWVGILGATGTFLSAVSLTPQVVRTWRTRSASDISAMWLVFAMGSMLIWTAYGGLIGAPAVILANILCFIQCGYILFVKWRSRSAPSASAADHAANLAN